MRSLSMPNSRAYIYFTLFLALVLNLLPLPFHAGLPDFLLLILLVWAVREPNLVGVGTAWISGMIFDLSQGTILGMHAVIYTAIIYFVVRFLPRLEKIPRWQQSIVIFLLVMFHSALEYWMMSIEGTKPDSWMFWLPAISSIIVWPLIWKI